MSGLMPATGRVAVHPYHIAVIDRNVYTLEELCYSILQSASFLDDELLDPMLVRWVREELELPELAGSLENLLEGENALSGFVDRILSETEYVSHTERLSCVEILQAGEGLHSYEQRFARADYLRKSGRFYQALAEYNALLEELPEPERRLRARTLHSRGILFAHLFRFAMAAESFDSAYQLSGDRRCYRDYLAAIRLYLPDADYVSFVAGHPEAYQESLGLEHILEEAAGEEERADSTRQITHLAELLDRGDEADLTEELGETVRILRENYRANMTIS